MTRRTGRFTPYSLIKAPNPIFDQELKHIRRVKSARALRRFSLLTLLAINALVIGLWVVVYINWQRSDPTSYGRYSFTYSAILRPLLNLLPGLALAASALSDVFYVFITATAINRQMVTGHWDLLRLTTLPEKDIIAANYAAAQIRGWTAMSVERALMVANIMLNFLWFSSFRMFYTSSSAFPGLPTYAVLTLISLVALLIMAFFAPSLRLRAITAMGLAVSARVRNSVFAIVAALAVVTTLHLILLAIANTTRLVRYPGGFYTYLMTNATIAVISCVMTLAAYIALRFVSLWYAERTAFRAE